MKVISFMNFKGGVAKTTSVCTIAGILGKADYRVLVVDLDPQCNSSSDFSVRVDNRDPNYERLFFEELTEDEVKHLVRKTNSIGVKLIPGSGYVAEFLDRIYDAEFSHRLEAQLREFQNITVESAVDTVEAVRKEMKTVMMKQRAQTLTNLQRNLRKLRNDFDFIIIDTAPFRTHLITAAMIASDIVITPVGVDNLSSDGVRELISWIARTRDLYDTSIEWGGVFFTKVKSNTNVFTYMYEQYVEEYGNKKVFPTYIRDCNKVNEANTFFTALTDYDADCTAVQDYLGLINDLGLMDSEHIRNYKEMVLAEKAAKKRKKKVPEDTSEAAQTESSAV